MKNNKKFFSLVFFLFLLGGGVTFFCDIGTLVKMKYFLFTDNTSNKSLFTAPPNVLFDNGFKKDSPESIRYWKSVIIQHVDYLKNFEEEVTSTVSTIDKAKLIALSFSTDRGGWCFDDINLIIKIKKIKDKGQGCCSDYSEVFIALCSIYGLEAREVHNKHHVFNEIYVPEKKKWLMIDPLFAIMAQNDKGEYLSLFEIRSLLFNDEKVNYVFWGTSSHEFYNYSADQHEYYDEKNDFSVITITWGNNVFAEDEFYGQMSVLPKSFKQLTGLTIGKTPSFLGYVDKFTP